ncbi:MAG: hypothetical protein AAF623_15775 [Planctomycetota bacterium]
MEPKQSESKSSGMDLLNQATSEDTNHYAETDSQYDHEVCGGHDKSTLSQQMIRSSENGIETVVSSYYLEFQAGQRREIVHIPLVPPLENSPDVYADATDHEDVRVRITDSQKYGIRAEVILSDQPATPIQRHVEFVISAQRNT